VGRRLQAIAARATDQNLAFSLPAMLRPLQGGAVHW
jgi:hypothetical protein